jgi:hypothetical protein
VLTEKFQMQGFAEMMILIPLISRHFRKMDMNLYSEAEAR